MNIIKELDKVNVKRCEEGFNMPLSEIKLNELSNMVTAEAGELAGICHKIEMDCYDHKLDGVKKDLEDELADVLITLHLCASKHGIDLQNVTARKFNEVSDRIGSDVKILEDRKTKVFTQQIIEEFALLKFPIDKKWTFAEPFKVDINHYKRVLWMEGFKEALIQMDY